MNEDPRPAPLKSRPLGLLLQGLGLTTIGLTFGGALLFLILALADGKPLAEALRFGGAPLVLGVLPLFAGVALLFAGRTLARREG
jgi:hypothetical protein